MSKTIINSIYPNFSQKEIDILKGLANKVAGFAMREGEKEKAKLWTAHNDLKTSQPLVFIDPENGWGEIITSESLECEHQLAREWEFSLKIRIYHAEYLKDDMVIDDYFNVGYVYETDGWGIDLIKIGGQNGGSYRVKQVIEDYEKDFDKIHFPNLIINFEATINRLALAEEIFCGILKVRQRNMWWWSLGLTNNYIELRGLEDFMCDFILEPEWMHRMMELLCEGNIKRISYLEKNGLLSLNTGNNYVGSGGFGFTDQLPQPDFTPNKVRTMDMWGFVESQETVSVSPDFYGEFVFPYHKKIADLFGLNCYGCCEPYEKRWKYVKNLPRLHRVSCSPWSDRTSMEENLGKNYIASIKLLPTHLASTVMDENVVRADIRAAVEGSKNCITELIMKDNNTLGGNPNNAIRWVELCREEIASVHL